MLIILGLYAAIIWLVFFKLKLLAWSTLSKTVVSLIGLAIVLVVIGLLNTRTPSGRFAVMSRVFEVAPVVSGTVAKLYVSPNQTVSAGDVLLSLDKRPFEYALQRADSAYEIARKTYERKEKAINKNSATVSVQSLDEARSELGLAEADKLLAQYNLDHTDIIAPTDGIVASLGVTVGEQITAFQPVLPIVDTGGAFLAAVFEQNGSAAIKPGIEVGLSFEALPGKIFWSEIKFVVSAMSDGQVYSGASLIGQQDVGSSSELMATINWPEELASEKPKIGSVGNATVIGPDAGAMGPLAKILLWIGAMVQFL